MKEISAEKYHGDTSRISKSGLDLITKSPKHYWAQYLDPKRDERKITSAFLQGGAIHVSILEPDAFSERYVVSPQINRRTNAGKDEWEYFKEQHGHKTILKVEDYDVAMRARDAVRSNETAAYLIRKGWAEKTWFWTDPETEAPCKCRTDFLNIDDFIIDVKSTPDGRSKQFGRSALKFRYDVQSPFYLDGVEQARQGQRPKAFIFICVEKAPPYNVSIFFATKEQIEVGRLKYKKDLAVYMQCRKSNIWPGYPEEIQPLELPNWAV